MLNFEYIQENYYNQFLKRYCTRKQITQSQCSSQIKQECMRAAEAKTYVSIVIPEEIQEFSVFNINGKNTSGKNILSIDTALKAKNNICNYCWGKTWEQLKQEFKDDIIIKKFLSQNSLMQERRDQGSNVMIWGESNSTLGKTMLASIIMKEAIRLRIIKNNRNHEYSWINWAALKSEIIKNTENMVDYLNCDWLVVDDIEDCRLYGEERSNRIISVMEPFFHHRLRNNLPTIFVFKFDVTQLRNISNYLGTTISSIYNRKSTYKIPLEGE